MTYRTGVLPHSPLKFVLASVRFAPWPIVAKRMDEIQDELRDFLPLMNHIVLEAVEGQGQTNANVHEAWMLADVDKSYCAQISKDQVIFFTNSYIDYKDFSRKNEKVLNILFKFMKFMDVTSVGIRYLDHIKPRDTETKSDYIVDKFLPPPVDGANTLGGRTNAEYQVGAYRVRTNILGMPGALPIPEEMIPLPLVLNGPEKAFQVESLKNEEFTFDIDSIAGYQNPKRLNLEDLGKIFGELHSVSNSFFRHTDIFTDHAFKIWKGES